MEFSSPQRAFRFASFEDFSLEDPTVDLSWFRASRQPTPEGAPRWGVEDGPVFQSSPGSAEEQQLAVEITKQYNGEATHRRGRRWTPEEDGLLMKMVERYGNDWRLIASHFSGKSSKQIKERWSNQLDPRISDHPWTNEDDYRLVALIREHGRSWCRISKEMTGRTELMLKNRFHSFLRKKINPEFFDSRGRISREEETAVRMKLAKFNRRTAISSSEPNRNKRYDREDKEDTKFENSMSWAAQPLI